MVAITFGVFAIGSPRRRIAAVSVAATRRAPLEALFVLDYVRHGRGLYHFRFLFVHRCGRV